MPGAYDLHINQGETFTLAFQWLIDEAPVDLGGGWNGRCQIRRAPPNPLTMALPVTITDAPEGRFSITLSAEQTALIPATGKGWDKTEKYAYDIELYTDSIVERILNGYVYVSPEVTR